MRTSSAQKARSTTRTRRPRGGGTPKFTDTERILDAAHACFARFGVMRTRLEDVAGAAGISRALLYQFFASRQALLDAVMNKEIADVAAKQSEAMRDVSGFVDTVVEGAVIGVELVRRNAVLNDLMAQSAVHYLPTFVLDPRQSAHRLVTAVWGPVFAKARKTGELRRDLKDKDLVEWLMCVQYTFTLREDLSAERQRELMRLFVVPALHRGRTARAATVIRRR